MTQIHPSAHVSPSAHLAEDVVIGPNAVVGPHVVLGAGCQVGPSCVIEGHTQAGKNNVFHAFSSIGCAPQDKKYKGEPTKLVIGDGNTFFQSVTISTGTAQDKGETIIGSNNWLMAYAHIGHDCILGDNIVMANAATLGGHVLVGNHSIIGGLSAVHQFCVIGSYCMMGGGSIVVQDLPPFSICEGNRAVVRGLNLEGIKRRGFAPEQVSAIKKAYRTLYRAGLSYEDAVAEITAQAKDAPIVQQYVEFFALSSRGIMR